MQSDKGGSVEAPVTAKRLLSIEEAQIALGVGRSTLYDLHANDRIRFTKIGRRTFVSAQELERFLTALGGGEAHDE